MSFIHDIIHSLTPLLNEAKERGRKNESTERDFKIAELARALYKIEDRSSKDFGDFSAKNPLLSQALTLSDLKTALLYSPPTFQLLAAHLDLKENLNILNTFFPVFEQIQNISSKVLKQISLFYLQLTGFQLDVLNSPVWYALCTDHQFLERKVRDLTALHFGKAVLALRMEEIKKRNPFLFDQYFPLPFVPPRSVRSLDLKLGKFAWLSESELHAIAGRVPQAAYRLLSNEQIKTLNVSYLSEEMLNELIAGDEVEENIKMRLTLLTGKAKL